MIVQEVEQPQLTLSGMISLLESLPLGAEVESLCHPKSYRGYHEQLAFGITDKYMPVREFLHNNIKPCVGMSYYGYRREGVWTMVPGTPVWIADYGELGYKITGVHRIWEYRYQFTVYKPDY